MPTPGRSSNYQRITDENEQKALSRRIDGDDDCTGDIRIYAERQVRARRRHEPGAFEAVERA
jgi:hypothetical protein